jgi:hypothetical protein
VLDDLPCDPNEEWIVNVKSSVQKWQQRSDRESHHQELGFAQVLH